MPHTEPVYVYTSDREQQVAQFDTVDEFVVWLENDCHIPDPFVTRTQSS